jgi:hypothetical protein
VDAFPSGLTGGLVAGRQADLAGRRGRAGFPAGRPRRRRPSPAGRRRPALARRLGRFLVVTGVRLAGPEAGGASRSLADAAR